MTTKVFRRKVFISASYLLDELTSVLNTLQETFAEFRTCFFQPTSKYSAFFSAFLFFKRSFGNVELSFDKLDEKYLPKVGFYRFMCEIDFKNGFFWLFFSKLSFGHVEWSTGLTTFAKNCFLEVQKLFDLSRRNFTKLQFLVSLCSRKCFAGLVAINFLTLPIKVCQFPKMFLSNFVAHYCEFLSKK